MLRFHLYDTAGDAFAWIYVRAARRGLRLSWLAAASSRCYRRARRVLEG